MRARIRHALAAVAIIAAAAVTVAAAPAVGALPALAAAPSRAQRVLATEADGGDASWAPVPLPASGASAAAALLPSLRTPSPALPQRLVVFKTPTSGSTWLADVLARQPGMRWFVREAHAACLRADETAALRGTRQARTQTGVSQLRGGSGSALLHKGTADALFARLGVSLQQPGACVARRHGPNGAHGAQGAGEGAVRSDEAVMSALRRPAGCPRACASGEAASLGAPFAGAVGMSVNRRHVPTLSDGQWMTLLAHTAPPNATRVLLWRRSNVLKWAISKERTKALRKACGGRHNLRRGEAAAAACARSAPHNITVDPKELINAAYALQEDAEEEAGWVRRVSPPGTLMEVRAAAAAGPALAPLARAFAVECCRALTPAQLSYEALQSQPSASLRAVRAHVGLAPLGAGADGAESEWLKLTSDDLHHALRNFDEVEAVMREGRHDCLLQMLHDVVPVERHAQCSRPSSSPSRRQVA